MKRFKVMLIYDSDKRYIFPLEILAEALGLSEADLAKLETAVLKEVQAVA